MTKPPINYDRDRLLGADAIIQDIKQFRNLEPLGLTDREIAHRMAATVKEVEQFRSLIGCGRVRLQSIGVAYGVRVLLGSRGIKTIGGLLSKTDKELLEIRGIGPLTLMKIKECICEYMEKNS
jgi:DNA-directed RNA polymerase alpha subunit